MSSVEPSARLPQTLGDVIAQVPAWLRQHIPATVISVVVGGLISYVSNVWLMFVRYGGWQKVPPGSPATGAGNLFSGALFWSLATGIAIAAVAYWRAVGTRRFFADLRALPSTMAGIVRKDGQGARVHLLWGAAIGLLAAQVVSPSVGALMAVGMVAVTPGPLGNILTATISRLWASITSRAAPDRQLRPVGSLGMAVGVLGSSAALVIGYFVSNRDVKWILAAAGVGGAIALGRAAAGKGPSPGSAAVIILVILAAASFADLLHPLVAAANDGGEAECGIKFYQVGAWLSQCDGSHAVLSHAVPGAVAGAVGAGVGGFVGSLAGLMARASGPLQDGPDGQDGPEGRDGQGQDGEDGQVPPGGPGPLTPGRATVRVSGGSIIITAANGVMISAPLLPNGGVGNWAYAGKAGPAGPDVTPEAEPSVLEPEPPPIPEPDWAAIDAIGDDATAAGAPDDQPPSGSGDGPPPASGPPSPVIDLNAVGQALNQLDWEVTDPDLYGRLTSLQDQLRSGQFGPDQVAALNQLIADQNVFAGSKLDQILTQRQQIADSGMYGPDGLLAQEQRSLAAEAQQRAVQAQIDAQEQYLSNHIDDLPLGQYEAAQRTLDRLVANDSPDPDTLGQLRQLSGSVFNLQQGASMADYAAAANSAAAAQLGMDIASNVQTAASVAEGAILFPFVVPGAAAVGADLGAFYLGRNLVQGLATGYAEGGMKQALINGAKSVLPVNLINAIYQGDSAGGILLATLQDIGNVAQLNAAGEALHNMGPVSVTFGEHPPPLVEPTPHNALEPQDVSWAESRAQGQANVDRFKQLTEDAKELEAAGNAAQAQATQAQVKDLVHDMNGEYQSKSFLKNAPSEVQAEFNRQLEPALNDARQGTVQALNEAGVQRGGRPISEADVLDLRNASSSGTVGMDRDLALNQMAERQLQAQLETVPHGSPAQQEMTKALEDLKSGQLVVTPETHPHLTMLQENGLLVKGTTGPGGANTLVGGGFSVNGQPISNEDVRNLAQHYYDRAYSTATGGRDPVTAMQGVTDAMHPEAYHDLNVLKNDPVRAPFDPKWADQTGSVTSFKGYEASSPGGPFHSDPWNAYQEVARGTAKDVDSKLLPLLQANNAPPEFVAQVQDMRAFLGDVKAGNLSPSQANALSQAKFGTDIQGLANRVDSAITASVKFGPAPPSGWSAMKPGDLASSAAGTAAQLASGVAGAPPTQIQDNRS